MSMVDPSNDLSREALEKLPTTLPVVPLRDSILFPRMVLPMAARRDVSLRALEAAVLPNVDRIVAAAHELLAHGAGQQVPT